MSKIRVNELSNFQDTTKVSVDEVVVAVKRIGKTGTSVNRPSATVVGAGVCYYDTTLQKPIWSNGSVWKDAMGTTV